MVKIVVEGEDKKDDKDEDENENEKNSSKIQNAMGSNQSVRQLVYSQVTKIQLNWWIDRLVMRTYGEDQGEGFTVDRNARLSVQQSNGERLKQKEGQIEKETGYEKEEEEEEEEKKRKREREKDTLSHHISRLIQFFFLSLPYAPFITFSSNNPYILLHTKQHEHKHRQGNGHGLGHDMTWAHRGL